MKIIQIKKGDPDFIGVKYAIKALCKSKDDQRPHIKKLFINNDGITATDGRRLHIYEPVKKYLKGMYLPTVNNRSVVVLEKRHTYKESKGIYPDYKHLLVQKKNHERVAYLWDDISLSQLLYKLNRHISGNTLRYKYLQDIGTGDWEVSTSEDGMMYFFENGRYTAFIMGCRTELGL